MKKRLSVKTKWLKTAYFWAELKKGKKTRNENYKCSMKKKTIDKHLIWEK